MRGLILLAMPSPALAHGAADADHWWTLDPWVVIPLLLMALLWLRGVLALRAKNSSLRATQPWAISCLCAAMTASFLALVWPLDALGEVSQAAHMAQHMMLIAVAAPLFVLAEPALPLMAGLPQRWRRINHRLGWLHRSVHALSRPQLAFALHATMIWLWHAPMLFEAALRSQAVHLLEHASFLGSALLFWNALQRTGRAGGWGIAALWTLATMMHTGLLGALITFAQWPLYPHYSTVEHALLPVMEDQQLAGLLMWVPAGLCYLIAGLGYAEAWLASAERGTRRSET